MDEGKVSKSRHVAKTISWRIIGSGATLIIAYLITGNFAFSGSIAVIQMIANTILYYIHERVWYRYIKFGVKE